MSETRSSMDGGVTRRGFLKGMAGILAAGFAPAAIGSDILMPIKKIVLLEPTVSMVTFQNRFFWVTNNSSVLMTIHSMEESGAWKVHTPCPIDLEPATALVYDRANDVFSKMTGYPREYIWQKHRP